MQNNFYKEIEGVKLPSGIDKVYLNLSFDKNNKNIWNKEFHFYISNCPCGSSEMSYLISPETLAKVWRVAIGGIEKSKDTLSSGGSVHVATIKNGKIIDLTKTI